MWRLSNDFYIDQNFGYSADYYPRLTHYLGPRYSANFQSRDLAKFLTYEAATGLNLFLSVLNNKGGFAKDAASLVKAVNEGFDIEESAIVFSVVPSSMDRPSRAGLLILRFSKEGDVVYARARCIDFAMWQLGGAAVALKLIQLASVSVYVCVYTSRY